MLSGTLHILDEDKLVTERSTGDVVGEGMFSPDAVRIAGVIAASESSVLVSTLADFHRLHRMHPTLAVQLERRLLAIYNEREAKNDRRFYVDTTQ